jgi:hypothetical protein
MKACTLLSFAMAEQSQEARAPEETFEARLRMHHTKSCNYIFNLGLVNG